MRLKQGNGNTQLFMSFRVRFGIQNHAIVTRVVFIHCRAGATQRPRIKCRQKAKRSTKGAIYFTRHASERR